MAYTAIDIVAGQPIEENWGDKVETHLERLGSYRGMIASAANLPDVSTLDEGDWYILKTEQQIRMKISGAYVALKFPPAPHANESHSTQMATSSELSTHSGNKSNPHAVTKTQVSLGSVQNYGIATQAEAEAGTATNKYLTPERVKQAIIALQSVKSVAGKIGTVTLAKEDVGLENLENYSIASEIDAQNASSNEKYMTPLRVKNLLDADARLASDRTRKITISESDPSGGSDGDVWIKY